MSDQGTQFLNKTIQVLTEEFRVYHQKSPLYHMQANGMVEAFNTILETALKKVCNVKHDDQDQRILSVLWAYRTTHKILISHTPFRLVYGKEAIIPMEFIVPSLTVDAMTNLMEEEASQKHLQYLMELEEDNFIVGFHQKVEKVQQKYWHDRHIKRKEFQQENLVLMYDSKFLKPPGKFQMHWLGTYRIEYITKVREVKISN